ncbi:MAG: tetratricopeptide repeat protein [Phycisphaeraceae bacterium]|nr:MAG: tetratricopeptide repeat protein [Phycisphaeraceae bacterium]
MPLRAAPLTALLSVAALTTLSLAQTDISFRGGSINRSLLGGHGGWSSGGGLTIDGRYSGGKWNLHFNLNNNAWPWSTGVSSASSGYFIIPSFWGYHTVAPGPGWVWDGFKWQPPATWLPYHFNRPSGVDAWGRVYTRRGIGPIDGMGPGFDPALLPGVGPDQFLKPAPPTAPPPPPPLSAPEKARLAMKASRPAEAIAHWKDHLAKEPEDHAAARVLAFCLLENREVEDAVALLRAAYTKDPGLADAPMDESAAGVSPSRLRDAVTRVVPHAHKTNSPSSWLAAAVFMQAEGRNTTALQMLERARKAGLERDVADRLAVALKPAPSPAPRPTPVPPTPHATPTAKPTAKP